MIQKKDVPLALSADALLGKSRVYIHRAFQSKANNDLDQYQFWASLSLELLGKSALSKIHSSLIVDPNHHQSILAASGIILSTQTRTISAHTLYKRLAHLSPKFDERVKSFCDGISERRNREIHSGEAPFRGMDLESWQSEYWHSSHVVLEMLGISFEEWLGADDAELPKSVLEGRKLAIQLSVEKRLEVAKARFLELRDSEKEAVSVNAEHRAKTFFLQILGFEADAQWEVACPACQSTSFMAGMQYEEEYVDGSAFEGVWTVVERGFEGEVFVCPFCDLTLQGSEEIEVSGLPSDKSQIEEQEIDYYPEYGNE